MDLVLPCDKTLFPMSPGRKTKATEHSSNDLGAEDDDIVTDSQSPIPQHSLFSAPHGHSHPAGKVFVERNREYESDLPGSNTRRGSRMMILLIFWPWMWTAKCRETSRSFKLYKLLPLNTINETMTWHDQWTFHLSGKWTGSYIVQAKSSRFSAISTMCSGTLHSEDHDSSNTMVLYITDKKLYSVSVLLVN